MININNIFLAFSIFGRSRWVSVIKAELFGTLDRIITSTGLVVITFFIVRFVHLYSKIVQSEHWISWIVILIGHYSSTGTNIVLESFMTVRPCRQYNQQYQQELIQEEFEDVKVVIRIRKSKRNRQHNGQKKNFKRTKNDLQNIHIKPH